MVIHSPLSDPKLPPNPGPFSLTLIFLVDLVNDFVQGGTDTVVDYLDIFCPGRAF